MKTGLKRYQCLKNSKFITIMESIGYYYNYGTIRPIEQIQFDPYFDIKSEYVLPHDLGIDIQDLYESMEPKRGGLIDPLLRMPTMVGDCSLCGLYYFDCLGHTGHSNNSDHHHNYCGIL